MKVDINARKNIQTSSLLLQNITIIADNKSPYAIQTRLVHIRVKGHSNFFHRNLGAIYVENSRIDFAHTDVEFINNTVYNAHGVPMYITSSAIDFVNSTVLFRNNRGSLSGAIVATEKTQLSFGLNTTVNFINNEGDEGGALSFYRQSVMVVDFPWLSQYHSIKLNFTSNLAIQGGGIICRRQKLFDSRWWEVVTLSLCWIDQ